MTVSISGLGLYAFALFVLFITPGPVWVAVIARTMSGGARAAVPLALGVALGDVIWALVAVMGVTWLVSQSTEIMFYLKYIAVAMFLLMGVLVLRAADRPIGENAGLTRPGMWAGFVAGLVAVTANPKAALFYIGLLPTFFDLSDVTALDVVFVALISAIVPFSGNLLLALFVDRMRRLLTSPKALLRMNVTSGVMLICVAILIAFT